MARKIHGWNDIPRGYVQEEDFHLAPFWLRVLARIKILERFAYPIAISKGLVKRWKIEPSADAPEFYWSDGIQYINKTYPGFNHGNKIETFAIKRTSKRIPFGFLKIWGLFWMSQKVFSQVFSGFYSTRWGRAMKSDYVKAKIRDKNK